MSRQWEDLRRDECSFLVPVSNLHHIKMVGGVLGMSFCGHRDKGEETDKEGSEGKKKDRSDLEREGSEQSVCEAGFRTEETFNHPCLSCLPPQDSSTQRTVIG